MIRSGLMAVLVVADLAGSACAAPWPTARHFDSSHTYRIALPLGGIGCGSVSLSGRGELCDWEIMNVPNKGMNGAECQGSSRTFFAVHVKDDET